MEDKSEFAVTAFGAGMGMLMAWPIFYRIGSKLFEGRPIMSVIATIISIAWLVIAVVLLVVGTHNGTAFRETPSSPKENDKPFMSQRDLNVMRFKVFAATAPVDELSDIAKDISHKIDKLIELGNEYPDFDREVDKFINVYVSRFMDSADAFVKFYDKNTEWEAATGKLRKSLDSLDGIATGLISKKEEEIQTDIITTSSAITQMAELKSTANKKP